MSIYDRHLAMLAQLVLGEQARKRFWGAQPLLKERQALGAVGEIGHRLRSDGAHIGFGVGDDRARAKGSRLHCYPKLPKIAVISDDRKRRKLHHSDYYTIITLCAKLW
jgi:hypothetical protein